MNRELNVSIIEVLELEGALCSEGKDKIPVYAHVTKPVKNGSSYAILTPMFNHGVMMLGGINPNSRRFNFYENVEEYYASYETASNDVINEIRATVDQLDRLKSIDDILGIEGITIKNRSVPE